MQPRKVSSNFRTHCTWTMGAALMTNLVTFDRCTHVVHAAKARGSVGQKHDDAAEMEAWRGPRSVIRVVRCSVQHAGPQLGFVGETGLLWAAAEAMELDALTLKKQALHGLLGSH